MVVCGRVVWVIRDEVWVRDGSGESRECDGEMQSDWEQCPEGCVGGCGGVVWEIDIQWWKKPH